MNEITKLVQENKVSKPVISKYEYFEGDIVMSPTKTDILYVENIEYTYDSFNLIDNAMYILFDSKEKLCYIFEIKDYKTLNKVLGGKLLTGQTKV